MVTFRRDHLQRPESVGAQGFAVYWLEVVTRWSRFGVTRSEVVTALVLQHDAEVANWSNELPSGDELMDQIEQFLAGREDSD